MNNYLKTVSTLAMAQGVAAHLNQMYAGKPRRATADKMIERITVAYESAAECWPDPNAKQISTIVKHMHRMQRVFYDTHISADTSYTLAILEDLLAHITDRKRYAAIDRLHTAIQKVHKYFDR